MNSQLISANPQTIQLRNRHPTVVGLLYANWCGHCNALKPAWNQMKQNINTKVNHNVYRKPHFMEVEHSQMDVLTQFNRQNQNYLVDQIKNDGFPTIFKIQNGNVTYYPPEQPRDAQPMEDWFMQDNSKHPRVTVHVFKKSQMTRQMKKKTLKRTTRKARSSRFPTNKQATAAR